MMKYYAGIEAGGTKFICAVADETGKIISKVRIPTTTSAETMPQVIDWLKKAYQETPFIAIGICSFGPTDINPHSPNYGYIAVTAKPGWGNFSFVDSIKEHFPMPVGFSTDVNGALLGEHRWGAGQDYNSLVYWTVGTGIGAGVIVQSNLMEGLSHSEMGHIFVPHNLEHDPFPGICPYHKDCLEGLASGPSMLARWNVKSALDLPPEHPAWDLEAEYLGYAMANCILSFMPERIILGGGVLKRQELVPKIQKKTLEYLNGFITYKNIVEHIDEYIVPAALKGDQGVLGAIVLAERVYHHQIW